eukprot:ANDGO_04527.mRNA.1 hypothetical protein
MGNKHSHDDHVSVPSVDLAPLHLLQGSQPLHLFSTHEFPIRIFLMQENRSNRTHTLLYDSVTPSKSIDVFGEIMFGALPFKVRTDQTKVHLIQSMESLVISKIFAVSSNSAQIEKMNEHAAQQQQTRADDDLQDRTSASRRSHAPRWSVTGQSSFEIEESDGEIRAHVMRRMTSFDGSSQILIDEDRLIGRSSVAAFRDFHASANSSSMGFSPARDCIQSTAVDRKGKPFINCRVQCALGVVFPIVSFEVLQRVFVVVEYRIRKLMRICRKLLSDHLVRRVQKECAQRASSDKISPPCNLSVNFVPQSLSNNAVLAAAVQDFKSTVFSFLSASLLRYPLWPYSIQSVDHAQAAYRCLMDGLAFLEHDAKLPFSATVLSCILGHHVSWIDTVAGNHFSSSGCSVKSADNSSVVRFPIGHHRLSVLGGVPFLRWLIDSVRHGSLDSTATDLPDLCRYIDASPQLKLCRIVFIEDAPVFKDSRSHKQVIPHLHKNGHAGPDFDSVGQALMSCASFFLRGAELDTNQHSILLPAVAEQNHQLNNSLDVSNIESELASLSSSVMYFAEWSERFCGDFVMQRVNRARFSLNSVFADMRLLIEQPFLEMDVYPSVVYTILVDVSKQIVEVVALSSSDADSIRSMDHLAFSEASMESLQGIQRFRWRCPPSFSKMLDSAVSMSKSNMPAELIVNYIHGYLQNVAYQARAVRGLAVDSVFMNRSSSESSTLFDDSVAETLGIDKDDVLFIRNVASSMS